MLRVWRRIPLQQCLRLLCDAITRVNVRHCPFRGQFYGMWSCASLEPLYRTDLWMSCEITGHPTKDIQPTTFHYDVGKRMMFKSTYLQFGKRVVCPSKVGVRFNIVLANCRSTWGWFSLAFKIRFEFIHVTLKVILWAFWMIFNSVWVNFIYVCANAPYLWNVGTHPCGIKTHKIWPF